MSVGIIWIVIIGIMKNVGSFSVNIIWNRRLSDMRFCWMNINALRPSKAYMCQRTRSSLVQVMSYRLFGTGPLLEPMLTYCHLDLEEYLSMEIWNSEVFIQENTFKMSAKWQSFCFGFNALMSSTISTCLGCFVVVCTLLLCLVKTRPVCCIY